MPGPRCFTLALAAALGLGACASATADAPLAVRLGAPRDEARAALRAAKFCPKVELGPQPALETYPRCGRAGAEWGQAWVTARYDRDTLVEVRRWERFTDDARALERWNELVSARLERAPSSTEAASALRQRGQLEEGTRAVKAWRLDADTVVGVFLLAPRPPEEAQVLELIMRAPAR